VRLLALAWGAILCALASAAHADEKQITVYRKGPPLRFDQDAGAELKEVILETYDCRSGKLVSQERIETYYHLSEDGEILTPSALCPDCERSFRIEKRGEKFFFLGIRERPAPPEAPTGREPQGGAAGTAGAPSTAAPPEAGREPPRAPPPTPAEAASLLEEKVKKISAAIVKVDPAKAGSASVRSKIITDELTTSLQGFGPPELEKIAGFVTGDGSLGVGQKYYVLRSFGFAFFERKDYPKAIFFYDKCIDLMPENYSGVFQKAVAEDLAGRADDAIRSYAKALALKPQTSIAQYFAKLAHAREGTEKLDAEKIAELRARLSAVEAALRKNDAATARSEASELDRRVRGWYGPGGGEATTAPATPAPGGN
jgi:tetratricopeptide (TPR) repeat protein